MFPSHSINDFANGTVISSKSNAHLPVGNSTKRVFGANGENCFGSKLVRVLTLSLGGISAPFCNHVPHIIGMSAKKNMVWIHAKRIVTLVASAHFFRNWAIVQNPRKSVSLKMFSVYYHRSVISTYRMILACSPQPARFGFVNVTPKSCNPFAGNSSNSSFFKKLVSIHGGDCVV